MAAYYQLVMDRSEIDEDDFSSTELDILEVLEDGRGTPAYIADQIDKSTPYVRDRLRDLTRLGLIRKVYRGLYELAEEDS